VKSSLTVTSEIDIEGWIGSVFSEQDVKQKSVVIKKKFNFHISILFCGFLQKYNFLYYILTRPTTLPEFSRMELSVLFERDGTASLRPAQFVADDVCCGPQRTSQFGDESARRKERADHLAVPFLQEEFAVVFVRRVYQKVDVVFPFVTHVHQLSLGERQQFVGQRLIGQVIEEQFAVVVGIVARNALFVVQHQLVADAEDHVPVRLLREEPFAQQARRFDISGLAHAHHLAQELGGIVAVFEHLIADDVVEFLVCERQRFGRGVYQLLVGIDAESSAAVGVVAEKLVGKDIGPERGIVARSISSTR